MYTNSNFDFAFSANELVELPIHLQFLPNGVCIWLYNYWRYGNRWLF